MTDTDSSNHIDLTADIVSAYVSKNSLPAADLPSLIESIHAALTRVATGARLPETVAPQDLKPAVPIKKSVTDDHIVCLEDGKIFKSLRRHLRTGYNMTPEEYRTKWGLDKNYPMVAPNYAKKRSDLAKQIGLGQKGRLAS